MRGLVTLARGLEVEARRRSRVGGLGGLELRLEDAVREVEQGLGDHPHIRLLLDAITSSKRGIARPETSTFEINVSN